MLFLRHGFRWRCFNAFAKPLITMINMNKMNRFLLTSIFLCSALFCQAQNNSKVMNHFKSKIDAFVSDTAYRCVADNSDVSSNPAYIKMLASPVLYNSIVSNTFRGKNDESAENENDKRRAVINSMLMNVYKNHPGKISMTEEQLHNHTTPVELKKQEAAVKIDVLPIIEEDVPDNVAGGLKTTVKKPNYWRTSGSYSMKFTQNYVSGNWYQGGENSRVLLSLLTLNLNYNDNNRITFTNKLDVNLGFTTVEADTLHSFKTNNDNLRLESTFGYKLVNNFDLTAKSKLETQMLPNYPTNSNDFVSKFMAPFNATFSIGINYKPKWKNISLEVFLAPLSAYNYTFVRYEQLRSRYSIRDTRHHREDFGTQLVVTVPSATLFKIVNWWSRAELYTNYERTSFSWENTFSIQLNRYFAVNMLLHARFDDNSYELKDDDHGYWQYKEYMTLGLTYSW